ncbi:hypothetical protein T12_2262 [Trichinella patagoniensis]|uniref:Uncharacterized protein n=1 Tax=Trichinella patagoniensis TaxID=990121 RepID=A0A0V0YSR8_9BILA|nr:hypothetical protein T12_2262 [Trichinella patagoniensis]
MREKLKDGGGGSCHMRSSTQSSRVIPKMKGTLLPF